MTAKPCDTCDKECVGGIIQGNGQQFLTWHSELNNTDVCREMILSLSRAMVSPE